MAKLTLTAMAAALENKSQEYFDKIDSMKSDLNLSENTVKTQTQLKTKSARDLLIMLTLVRDMMDKGDTEVELPGDVAKWFEATTTLTADRKAKNMVIFHEGDNMMEIMDAHPNKNYSQLKKLMDEQGFRLDGSTVVRK